MFQRIIYEFFCDRIDIESAAIKNLNPTYHFIVVINLHQIFQRCKITIQLIEFCLIIGFNKYQLKNL